MVSIIGYYTTQFGELWEKSLFSLVGEAIDNVLIESGLEKKQIDAVFFGNMLSGILENNLHASAKIAEILKLNIPIFRVEAACASGGSAFNLAVNYVKSQAAETVLVVGAEKMTDFSPEQVVGGLSAASSGEEQESGLTFPGIYALMAQSYLNKNKTKEEDLACISVKNHFHGSLNDKAHFRRQISVSDVLNSAYVAYPLKVLDSSPISDGASSVIITSNKKIIKKAKKPVMVLASEVVNDTISLKKRKNLDSIEATIIAADKVFKKTGLKRKDITVAELHDCFSIAEIIAMEDIGFWKKGEGASGARAYSTMFGRSDNLVVNTSGGLKSAGHPVGATGIKQLGEIYLQLTGRAEKRQVKGAKYGLAHNVGGSGGTVVITILGN
ncbi:hypothetical protein A3C23_01405 [Candidatus Roizmanbacteria bacterium RIFCSPHIGHO2_02_FULL_37_13b]|uniref:Acetyl-CoA acetyltransferase n=1 Tax=Candidatus Roizmanbacteria bacterium RIFCSPLOWO2_02_FULL_36_11 TaxID=1802071 RepID=A0A1F7JC52_9BACT|nr:MAG: hypothetical protein A3C23_01405 [Candidatus Roizmanbacteria bacterium RIFCSPHIGHO2_02_FULL_37_13b]OGK53199.1 MAG: hypothetical protein A3H78_02585 [Candidatus Roizmanbacteria bacterium RIFCSPLOWO2_02_FULL_36_11]